MFGARKKSNKNMSASFITMQRPLTAPPLPVVATKWPAGTLVFCVLFAVVKKVLEPP